MAVKKFFCISLIAGLCITLFCSVIHARTSLVALPERHLSAVKLQSGKPTLIQETRILSLKKGLNRIDFSWQGVRIDPASIQIEPLSHPGDITILSVSFPPGESALIWQIHSKTDVEEQVVLSYLLAGIDSLMTYTAVADPKEKLIRLDADLVLRNFSGEDFAGAQMMINHSLPFQTDTRNLETKRITLRQWPNVKIEKQYTWDAMKMPHDPENSTEAVGIPVSYKIINAKTDGLGESELIEGKARVFQDDKKGGTIFLGEDICQYTPPGDFVLVNIGDSRDIIVTRRIMNMTKTNVRKNKKGQIQAHDEAYDVTITMENTKDQAVTLSVIEWIPGQWEAVAISMNYKKRDARQIEFQVALSPKEKKTLQLRYKVLNIFTGRFARFNFVH